MAKRDEPTWRVSFTAPASMAVSSTAWADEFFPTYSVFEQPDKAMKFDLLVHGHAPNKAGIDVCLALMAKTAGCPSPTAKIVEVPATDWRAVTYAAFPPVPIGRFVIHGSHHRAGVRPGAYGLQIDAATAFGTGEHPTTAGCLHALELVSKRCPKPARLLDVGTGSGILAMAMARLWHRPIVATDIDAEAVRVSKENVADNGLNRWITVLETGHLHNREVKANAPYDLIVANILARPLIGLSRDIGRSTKPGTTVILSGLLNHQAAAVIAWYRKQGLALTDRLIIGEWTTLILKKRR